MKPDPRRSTQYFLFQNHYASLEEELTWTVDRLRRLCAALQLTEWEVGAMVRVKIAEMSRYMKTNDFPAPVELHLSLIERAIFPSSKPSLIPNAS